MKIDGRTRIRTVGIVAFALALLMACSSGSSDQVALSTLASGCLIDSDCRSPLVCAFKTCHEQCSTDDGSASPDCPANELCVASDRPYHVCEAITACALNSDCPEPLVCGRDLECRDQCSTDRDCVAGQLCVTGTCASTSDHKDGGLVAPSDAATSSSNTNPPCSFNSDCPPNEICRSNGFCGVQCESDRDCEPGSACAEGLCVALAIDSGSGGDVDAGSMDANVADTYVADSNVADTTLRDTSTASMNIPDGAPDGYGVQCVHNSDCATVATNLVCLSSQCVYACINNLDCDTTHGECCGALHTCIGGTACVVAIDAAASIDSSVAAVDAGHACEDDAQCQDGLFCDGIEQCVAGFCHAASIAACDDGNPCTTDACTESSRGCTHVATGPQDLDGDQHFAIACGGDDCDDTNPNVYPGHAEICDQIDNNCDGYADEGLWAIGPTSTIAGLGNQYNITPNAVLLTSGPHAGDLVIVAAEGGSGNGYGDNAVVVDTSFNIVVAATNLPNYANCGRGISGIATDGSGFAVATGGCNEFEEVAVGDGLLSNLGYASLTESTNSAGSVAWDSAQNAYATAWPDSRNNDGHFHVYLGLTSQAGVISNVHELETNSTDDIASYASVASSGSNTLIAFNYDYNASHVRYGIMDTKLTALQLPGLSELTEPEDQGVSQGTFYLGGSYVMLTAGNSSQSTRLRTLDGTTGVVTATQTYTNPSQPSFIEIAPIGNAGIGVLENNGGAIRFGFAPLALNKGVSFTDIGVTSAATVYGSPTTIDAKHVVLTWVRNGVGTVSAAMLTCSP